MLLCPPPSSRSWPVRGRQRGCCSVLHRPHGRGPSVDDRGDAALSSTILTVVACPWTTEGVLLCPPPSSRSWPVDDRGGAALSSTVLTVMARSWTTEGMLLCPPPSSRSWPVRGRQRGCCSVLHRPHGHGPSVDDRGGAALSSTALTVVARPWTTEGMLLCPPPSSRSWPARGLQRGCCSVLHRPHGRGPPVDDRGVLLCPPPSSRSWPARGRQRGCCSVLHRPHGRGPSVDDRGNAALSSTVLTVVARGQQRGCCSVLHRPHGCGPSVDDRGGAALSSTVLTVVARPWTTEGDAALSSTVLTVVARPWTTEGCCSVLHRPHGRGRAWARCCNCCVRPSAES
ncbi:uncharacterized protein LOC126058027 isoform X3 [Elephas maximus indicus]|uniref:uncharacterized protein LOC126058027 isoform X3 n=1 Tax=Elephas maximus indicus TaxID=99487 RepID=UPI002115F092|nr:uncharacterized protein LOC126058027 isoform X3 [Elephas maximus indicus]